jgi:hypothetical protein
MIRTTDVLGALSAAADLALGMPEAHAAFAVEHDLLS